MFQHHLLLIYRNFKRHKASFFINLIGLSAGLSCALLIYLWVNDEVMMDQFHGKQLYQVMVNEEIGDGINTVDATSGPLAEALKEFPEVEASVVASPSFWLAQSRVAVGNGPTIKAGGKFASADFFKAFSYPLLYGNINDALKGKNTVIVSEGLALKLFHTTDVVGKKMVWGNTELKDQNHALITGVFKDITQSSSDHFDFLVSADMLFSTPTYLKWGNYGPNTFVVLKKNVDPDQFNVKIEHFMKSKGQNHRTLFIRPYADSYLYNHYENGKLAGGRIDYVRLFSLIAIFILVIACINFMNLSTAKASRRMKEVGVKKVLGARREVLVLQYLGESMLLTFLSLFVSLLIVELLLPEFNAIVDKQLSLHFNAALILPMLGITVFTGFIAGSYPALYLSGFNPAAALKGKLNLSSSAAWTRQGLVIFQFTLSVILIVAVFVIYKQIEYVQTKNQGYKKDNVLYFETEGKFKDNVNFALTEIKKVPGVLQASSMDREFFGDLSYTFGDFNWEGRNPKEVIKFQRARINEGLIETMGMKMAEGRSFSKRFGADTLKIIVNEAGIKVMRLKNPISKIFNVWGKDFEIIGVVKDFNFESLHEPIKPMFLLYEAEHTNRIMVSIAKGKERTAIEGLQQLNSTYNPGYGFGYRFLDQDFQAQYTSESRIAVLSRYFAFLAGVISCLGLFGLATFTAERRIKEIGIRKILGASELNIIYILSKDFIRPVIVAILIALPLSYILTKYWLNTFAYSIELQLWYFATAGLLALLISFITVFMQALKAANVNPIQSLKTE